MAWQTVCRWQPLWCASWKGELASRESNQQSALHAECVSKQLIVVLLERQRQFYRQLEKRAAAHVGSENSMTLETVVMWTNDAKWKAQLVKWNKHVKAKSAFIHSLSCCHGNKGSESVVTSLRHGGDSTWLVCQNNDMEIRHTKNHPIFSPHPQSVTYLLATERSHPL